VEAVLAQHPDLDKCVVIGLPHDRWGEAVTAVAIRREGTEPTAEEIIKFSRQTLAGYEAPKDVIFTGSLPETVGGKVLKYKLRAEHAAHYNPAPGAPGA
jgi:acyl-CoA synthetase (AMP-forming)/AMP-acid ligase II